MAYLAIPPRMRDRALVTHPREDETAAASFTPTSCSSSAAAASSTPCKACRSTRVRRSICCHARADDPIRTASVTSPPSQEIAGETRFTNNIVATAGPRGRSRRGCDASDPDSRARCRIAHADSKPMTTTPAVIGFTRLVVQAAHDGDAHSFSRHSPLPRAQAHDAVLYCLFVKQGRHEITIDGGYYNSDSAVGHVHRRGVVRLSHDRRDRGSWLVDACERGHHSRAR